jgi:hypothetical protein
VARHRLNSAKAPCALDIQLLPPDCGQPAAAARRGQGIIVPGLRRARLACERARSLYIHMRGLPDWRKPLVRCETLG